MEMNEEQDSEEGTELSLPGMKLNNNIVTLF